MNYQKTVILIVDDNESLRLVNQHLLNSAGYGTLTAVDGEQALLMMEEHLPDLVLLDRHMPRMDGLEVCRRIKSNPKLASTFVIFFSGANVDADSQAIGLDMGADGYITQPISNREFLARVQAFVRIKGAEDALRKQEEQYRNLITHHLDGLLVVDMDLKGLFANPEACRLLNLTEKELVGKKIDLPLAKDIFAEIELTRVDGTNRFVELRVSEIEWQFKAAWLVAMRDVTERRLAEEALLQSEARFRLYFEQAGVGVAQVESKTGRYLQVNSKYSEILGYSHDELLQMTFMQISFEEDIKQDWEVLNQLIDGSIRKYELEKRYIRKDGALIWARITCTAAWQAGEETTWHICVLEDITDKKQAEEKIIELNKLLEKRVEERTKELVEAQEKLVRQERLAVLGQLAGSVGHELRNPLGVMANAVYFLNLAQPDAPAKVKEYLSILQKEIRTSDKIINDLLDFSRPIASDKSLVSADSIVKDALERFPIPENVELKLKIAKKLPLLSVDSSQITQVLGNLVVNAHQAMKKGGELQLSAGLIRVKGKKSLCFSVEDAGEGIKPENLMKIFEPLFTTKARGIGLGLAVCKKLVEVNDGRIEVESEVGKGTIFRVYFPVEQDALV